MTHRVKNSGPKQLLRKLRNKILDSVVILPLKVSFSVLKSGSLFIYIFIDPAGILAGVKIPSRHPCSPRF